MMINEAAERLLGQKLAHGIGYNATCRHCQPERAGAAPLDVPTLVEALNDLDDGDALITLRSWADAEKVLEVVPDEAFIAPSAAGRLIAAAYARHLAPSEPPGLAILDEHPNGRARLSEGTER